MKTKQFFLVLTALVVSAFSGALTAQEGLHIDKVFETYGKKKGVVMVDLSGEMLSEYDFARFKSIVINDNPRAGDLIRDCIAKDEKGAKKIKHIVANGKTTSIYLELPMIGNSGLYRIILFKEATPPEDLLTLIYIESRKSSEEVLDIILQKGN